MERSKRDRPPALGWAAVLVVSLAALGTGTPARAHRLNSGQHQLDMMSLLPTHCQSLHQMDDPSNDLKTIPCATQHYRMECAKFHGMLMSLPPRCPDINVSAAIPVIFACMNERGNQLWKYQANYRAAAAALGTQQGVCASLSAKAAFEAQRRRKEQERRHVGRRTAMEYGGVPVREESSSVCRFFSDTCAAIRKGEACLEAAKKAGKDIVARFPALGPLLGFNWSWNAVKALVASTRSIATAAGKCGSWLKEVATTAVGEVKEKIKEAICDTSLGRQWCPAIAQAADCYREAMKFKGRIPVAVLSGLSQFRDGIAGVSRAILSSAQSALKPALAACRSALAKVRGAGQKTWDKIKRWTSAVATKYCLVNTGDCVSKWAWDYLNAKVPNGATRRVELKGELMGSVEGVVAGGENSGTVTFARQGDHFDVTFELARQRDVGGGDLEKSFTGGTSGGTVIKTRIRNRQEMVAVAKLFVGTVAQDAIKSFIKGTLNTFPPVATWGGLAPDSALNWIASKVVGLFGVGVTAGLLRKLAKSGVLQEIEYEGCLQVTAQGDASLAGHKGDAKASGGGCLGVGINADGDATIKVGLKVGGEGGLGAELGGLLKGSVKLAGGIGGTALVTVKCGLDMGKAVSSKSLRTAALDRCMKRKSTDGEYKAYSLSLGISAQGSVSGTFARKKKSSTSKKAQGGSFSFSATATGGGGSVTSGFGLGRLLNKLKRGLKSGGWAHRGSWTLNLTLVPRQHAYEKEGKFIKGGIGLSSAEVCPGYCSGTFDVDKVLSGDFSGLQGSCRSTCRAAGTAVAWKNKPTTSLPTPPSSPDDRCPRDYERVRGGPCVPKCGRNQVRTRSGVCACRQGMEKVEGHCRQRCETGQIRNFLGKCVYRCVRGQVLHGNRCVDRCPSGWIQAHWRCVRQGGGGALGQSRPEAAKRCRSGLVRDGNRCAKKKPARGTRSCKMGRTYKAIGGCRCAAETGEWRPVVRRGKAVGWKCQRKGRAKGKQRAKKGKPRRPGAKTGAKAARSGPHIAEGKVSLRVAPGSASVATLERCQPVRILRRGVQKYGTSWMLVRAGGKTGYVQSQSVKEGRCQ